MLEVGKLREAYDTLKKVLELATNGREKADNMKMLAISTRYRILSLVLTHMYKEEVCCFMPFPELPLREKRAVARAIEEDLERLLEGQRKHAPGYFNWRWSQKMNEHQDLVDQVLQTALPFLFEAQPKKPDFEQVKLLVVHYCCYETNYNH